jgi:hypothetical protein
MKFLSRDMGQNDRYGTIVNASAGRLAQLEEHSVYTRKVIGSSPIPPISPEPKRLNNSSTPTKNPRKHHHSGEFTWPTQHCTQSDPQCGLRN